ncbi:MAG TPA: nuclear transport factor 2 family protein [Pyrinomonadaceae bacterium]|nr:nuclear transport factor 2 family protein [Pyrinomonadaceae bacterium]
MSYICIFILVTLALPFSALQISESQTRQGNEAEQEVRRLERAWLDAYEQHDAKAMDTIVADDFVITFPDGSMQTKSQILDSIKAPRNRASLSLKFYTEDVRARVYGETVILTGRVVTEYPREGKTVKEQSRYTDTYIKRQGRWQVVASHLSNSPQPEQRSATVSSNSGAGRSLHGNRLLSLKFPSIKIDVDEQLPHIGILNFTLKGVAQVERYVYARAGEGGRVQRLLIMQFEGILPGVKGGYSFQVTDATRLGEHDYQTNLGVFNFAQTIAANPGAEAEQTRAFLDGKGLKVDDDYLVARYARIVDTEKRHELIFFYLENLRDLGFTRAELEPGGRRAPEAEKVFNDFAARARQSFKVVDGKP